MQGGHLEFAYVLADRSWTWQRRLGNPKISGMSLLGTVKKCAGETVQLELDIDSGRPGQPCYPWTWVPTTGNLMYPNLPKLLYIGFKLIPQIPYKIGV